MISANNVVADKAAFRELESAVGAPVGQHDWFAGGFSVNHNTVPAYLATEQVLADLVPSSDDIPGIERIFLMGSVRNDRRRLSGSRDRSLHASSPYIYAGQLQT
jgi:hypothetical protein